MALNEESRPAPEVRPYPESAAAHQRDAEVLQSIKHAGLGLAALAAVGALFWKFARKN
jgi:hypothetical protein